MVIFVFIYILQLPRTTISNSEKLTHPTMYIIMNAIEKHTHVVGVVWGFIRLAFRPGAWQYFQMLFYTLH